MDAACMSPATSASLRLTDFLAAFLEALSASRSTMAFTTRAAPMSGSVKMSSALSDRMSPTTATGIVPSSMSIPRALRAFASPDLSPGRRNESTILPSSFLK